MLLKIIRTTSGIGVLKYHKCAPLILENIEIEEILADIIFLALCKTKYTKHLT